MWALLVEQVCDVESLMIGSGKSTLVAAILRILTPISGCIKIDDLDISTLKLKTLRRGIQLVSQEPVVLPGTIRNNIDEEGIYSDESIWSVLKTVGLDSYVSGLPEKLEHGIKSKGFVRNC